MSNTVASSVVNGGWIETTLGKLAEYITSGSRDWSRYYADSGAIFIRTQDINQNRLSLEEVAFVKLPEKVEGKRSFVRKGDLLVTITGANVGKVAVVEGEIPEAYVSQSVCLVRLKDPSLAKFVHLQLTAKRGDKTTVESMAYGLGRPVLNLENIRSAPIRVAPAKVQVVIVAEIEKQFSRLDEAVENLKRVKANLKRYKAAVLKVAVEGKLTEDWRKQHSDVEPASKLLERILAERRAKWNRRGKYKELAQPDSSNFPHLPDGWVWASLSQLSIVITKGTTPTSLGSTFHETGIRFVKAESLKRGVIDHGMCSFIDEATNILLARSQLRNNDVLFTIAGTLGRVAIVRSFDVPANTNQAVAIIRMADPSISKFVSIALMNPEIGSLIEAQRRGVGLFNLNLEQVAHIIIPLPPITEVHPIVAEVERRLSVIDELETAVEANLTRADCFKQSILRTAFSGRLSNEG